MAIALEVPTNAKQLGDLITAFTSAAAAAGLSVPTNAIDSEFLAAPHRQPACLPARKQAIYWFSTVMKS